MSGRLILLTHQTPFRPRSEGAEWVAGGCFALVSHMQPGGERFWEADCRRRRPDFRLGLGSGTSKALFGASGVFEGFNGFDGSSKDGDGNHLRDFVAGTELD
jgi:hypothetical protein